MILSIFNVLINNLCLLLADTPKEKLFFLIYYLFSCY
jgi:hypothetical protein